MQCARPGKRTLKGVSSQLLILCSEAFGLRAYKVGDLEHASLRHLRTRLPLYLCGYQGAQHLSEF